MPSSITIRVDFPALSDLVAYLRQAGDQQRQIDALAAQVRDLTNGLQQSAEHLHGAVQENQ